MAILGFEIEEIARLLALMQAQGLAEILIEDEGRYLRIRGANWKTGGKSSYTPPVMPTLPLPPPSEVARAVPPAPRRSHKKKPVEQKAPELTENQIALESPMVGVFYRSEKPGAPPFVNVGDPVSVGQVVGVIEAMKVFSEFKAEHSGTVVAIPGPDGQMVQAGTPLIILRV